MRKSIRFIDLFAGIGGIRLGFEKAGAKCVWSNDYDKHAAVTYIENFGNDDFVLEDIKKVSSSEIPDFDILCGGFPCQPFSIAGISKKNSLGRPNGFADQTQGTLFYEIVRIIKEKRPKAFFLENVKNLERHDKGRTFYVIKDILENLGYSFYHKILDAKTVVPQHRERIFMVGFRNKNLDFDFPKIMDRKLAMKDILEQDIPEKYTLTDHLWNYLQKYAEKHKAKGNGFGFGLVNFNSYSRTLSARYHKDGSEILIPQKNKNPRKLTPRECARLQGFPDTFKIPVSDTQAYRQFGNAVAVPIIELVANEVMKTLTEKPKRKTPYTIQQKMEFTLAA